MYSIAKRSLLLLLAAMLACPPPALADTVTIGFFESPQWRSLPRLMIEAQSRLLTLALAFYR